MLITLIHDFEIDMDQISIFMWNPCQNVSLELVGINAQTLFFKFSAFKGSHSETSQPILFAMLLQLEWMFLQLLRHGFLS